MYHITHVDNLAAIVASGCLLSDAAMAAKGGPQRSIGMSRIKQRRLEEIVVPPHPGTHVGDYVPFNFCPRSVMLYVIHRGNDADLSYRGGQWPILHLRADATRVIDWAEAEGGRGPSSFTNAGNRLAEFSARRQDLDRLDRTAIESLDFRDRAVKEAKQAEFLIHDRLPFEFIDKIGAATDTVRGQALEILAASGYEPNVETTPTWYYR
ncbi:MAG: DUF4433 domain-containing protein [bacterium]|nr:DUF4433 domain-containing protein [bacterium]